MRRREVIGLFGVAAAAWPAAAYAQGSARVYRLGMLSDLPHANAIYAALFDELRRSGFVEGQTLRVEGGFAMRGEEASKVAAMLVAAGVDAILVTGRLAHVAQKATRTVPIIAIANDLVLMGLAGSLAHPGGDTTGISILATELDLKRQELLTGLVPAARRLAALADPAVSEPEHLQSLEDAARRRGIALSIHRAAKPEEIIPAIDAAKASGAQALNVLTSALFESRHRVIIERTGRLQLPAIYQWPDNAEAGGLAAYGPRFTEIGRQLARQIVKIFRGAKPADIPVEQPDKFELVINLKTAKALGLAIPQSLLARADEVIE